MIYDWVADYLVNLVHYGTWDAAGADDFTVLLHNLAPLGPHLSPQLRAVWAAFGVVVYQSDMGGAAVPQLPAAWPAEANVQAVAAHMDSFHLPPNRALEVVVAILAGWQPDLALLGPAAIQEARPVVVRLLDGIIWRAIVDVEPLLGEDHLGLDGTRLAEIPGLVEFAREIILAPPGDGCDFCVSKWQHGRVVHWHEAGEFGACQPWLCEDWHAIQAWDPNEGISLWNYVRRAVHGCRPGFDFACARLPGMDRAQFSQSVVSGLLHTGLWLLHDCLLLPVNAVYWVDGQLNPRFSRTGFDAALYPLLRQRLLVRLDPDAPEYVPGLPLLGGWTEGHYILCGNGDAGYVIQDATALHLVDGHHDGRCPFKKCPRHDLSVRRQAGICYHRG